MTTRLASRYDKSAARQNGSSSGASKTPASSTRDDAISETSMPSIMAIDASTFTTGQGGGSLRSIDETFKVNPSNGTLSFNLPLRTTEARNKFSPSLSLSYNSGSGNGPFGIGWQ